MPRVAWGTCRRYRPVSTVIRMNTLRASFACPAPPADECIRRRRYSVKEIRMSKHAASSGDAAFCPLSLRRGRGAKYCDEYGRLSVCLSLHSHDSNTTQVNFTKSDKLCVNGFVDDNAHDGPYGASCVYAYENLYFTRIISGSKQR